MRLLRDADVKPMLKLSTKETKELVVAGVNGDSDFPELLSKYRWSSSTRDYSVALIIIAFYAYCLKSKNAELKRFALTLTQDGSNSKKLFEYLKEGNGRQVKDCMRPSFFMAMDGVLEEFLQGNENEDNEKRFKIIESFRNRAGKITSWRINGGEISNLVDKLTNKVDRQIEEDTRASANQHPDNDIKELEDMTDSMLAGLAEERAIRQEINQAKMRHKPSTKMRAKGAASNIVKPKEESGNKSKIGSASKVAEETAKQTEEVVERKSKEKAAENVENCLNDSAKFVKQNFGANSFAALKNIAGSFKKIKDIVGEHEYKNRLSTLLKDYSKELSTANEFLSKEQVEALFSNIINITAEVCDGKPYFSYYVDGKSAYKELKSESGAKLRDLVNFETLKYGCPTALECNFLDSGKVFAAIKKMYPRIPDFIGKLFSNGPTGVDFFSWKFKPFSWEKLAKCGQFTLGYDLIVCFKDLKIKTK